MRQLTIIITFLLAFHLQAQEENGMWCGSFSSIEEHELQTERLLDRVRSLQNSTGQSREVVYIPVKFHLSARSDGSGRVSEGKVLDQLCELNEDYAPYEMQFYIADGTFNYINNTSLYENHLAVQNSIMQPQRDTRAVNIFIVESVDDPDEPGTTLAYYHTIRDWIVTRKASVTANKIDITHEVGHFFSLLHTFNGWECESYEVVNVPAPTMASCGSPATEFQNGNNCQSSGDFVCDTPPDYGFSSPCNFTANVLDPNGEQVHPDETNYLSYFLSCPDEDYHYTDMQAALMRQDYDHPSRNFLRINPVPSIVEITDSPTHIYPAPGSTVTVDFYNHVNLQWTAVSGATSYFVEISRTSSFTVNPIRRVVNGTSLLVEELDVDKKYYWRVRPFNEHIACVSASETESFESGLVDFTTSTQEVPDFVNSFVISPNPLKSGQELNVLLELEEAVAGQVRLIDVTGRLINTMDNLTFNKGENRLNLGTSSLKNGLYFIQLETGKGQITRKIVVTN